jgi:hypothetical protein
LKQETRCLGLDEARQLRLAELSKDPRLFKTAEKFLSERYYQLNTNIFTFDCCRELSVTYSIDGNILLWQQVSLLNIERLSL